MKSFSFESQIDTLRNKLEQDLPGVTAHLTMAPGFRSKPEVLSITDKPCRSAGVLAVLYPQQDASPGILLTKRREDLPEHAGQIAFPGGRQEGYESLVETALRETEEEIGIAANSVHVIGALTPIYIDVSNYCVHPFVGVIDRVPPIFNIQEDEVQKVLQLPIAQLASPNNQRREMRTIRGHSMEVPFFDVDQEIVWGATAMILAELLMIMTTKA